MADAMVAIPSAHELALMARENARTHGEDRRARTRAALTQFADQLHELIIHSRKPEEGAAYQAAAKGRYKVMLCDYGFPGRPKAEQSESSDSRLAYFAGYPCSMLFRGHPRPREDQPQKPWGPDSLPDKKTALMLVKERLTDNEDVYVRTRRPEPNRNDPGGIEFWYVFDVKKNNEERAAAQARRQAEANQVNMDQYMSQHPERTDLAAAVAPPVSDGRIKTKPRIPRAHPVEQGTP
jgi:hypothetical protein